MIITLIMSKNKRYALKIVIFKKPKKRGSIQNKRYAKNHDIIKLKTLNDITTKCVLTNTQYSLASIPRPIKFFKHKAIIFDACMKIQFAKAISYNSGLLPKLLEIYIDAKDDSELDVYQMNLIGADN